MTTLFNDEYESLDKICFECGRYGHRRESCPKIASYASEQHNPENMAQSSRAPKIVREKESSPARVSPVTEEGFGPWMMVGKPTLSQLSKKNQSRGNLPKKKGYSEG